METEKSNDKVRVVIIDDDKVTIFLSLKILTHDRPEIVTSHFFSGIEAIRFLKTIRYNEPTVLLLDINMPDYNGWDFLRDHAELNLPYPVFMFTSSIDVRDVEISKTFSKVLGFISKPLTTEKVDQFLSDAFA